MLKIQTWSTSCYTGISWLNIYTNRPLQWRHNGPDSISNHQPHDCFLNRLFRLRSKKTSKPLVTGLCAGNSPGTGEFPAQMASNTENVGIWWRHHDNYMHMYMSEIRYSGHMFSFVVSLFLDYYTCLGRGVIICEWHTVYPKKYAHGFVMLCFVVVMQSFIMNSHEVFNPYSSGLLCWHWGNR